MTASHLDLDRPSGVPRRRVWRLAIKLRDLADRESVTEREAYDALLHAAWIFHVLCHMHDNDRPAATPRS